MIPCRTTLLALLITFHAALCVAADPAKLDPEALKTRLPRGAAKLIENKPYTIVVIGEESAAEWPKAFARLLGAATGNDKITVVSATMGPRAAEDAAALLDRDVLPVKPDLALVRLGAVDVAQGRTVESYLEAQTWLAGQLGSRCGADVVLCQPAAQGDHAGDVAALAHWLGLLAQRRDLPLAATVDTGEPEATALAVLDALRAPTAAPVSLSAVLRWTSRGPRARITLRNVSEQRRSGRLSLLPRADERFDLTEPQSYDLEPQAAVELDVGWLGCESGARLLAEPYGRLFAGGRTMLTVVETTAAGHRLWGVEGRFAPEAYWVRNDGEVSLANRLRVSIEAAGRSQAREVSWPADSEVGRVRLLEPVVDREGAQGWAATELYYLRFAGALGGETTIDGQLKEWSAARWSTLSDPAQVRARPGVSVAPPNLKWAARIGRRGLSVAISGQGRLTDDRFTLALDARPMALLGTVGRTFWVDGALRPDGGVTLTPGETSPADLQGISGAWRASEAGLDIELSLPYSLMEEPQWPEEGDIGFTLLWRHDGVTLNWSGDGEWLSPREYGVLHRLTSAREKLPWVVRVR